MASPISANKAELLAGTNPVENLTSPSVPEITSVIVAEGKESVTLRWRAEPGAVYIVEYSSDLVSWKDAGDGKITNGANATELEWQDAGAPATDTTPADAIRRYYRVRRVR